MSVNQKLLESLEIGGMDEVEAAKAIRGLEAELAALRKAEKEWHRDEEQLREEFKARAEKAEAERDALACDHEPCDHEEQLERLKARIRDLEARMRVRALLTFERRVDQLWVVPSRSILYSAHQDGTPYIYQPDESGPAGLYPAIIVPGNLLGKVIKIRSEVVE